MQTIASILPRLANPGPDFRGTPFWAWNAKLDPDECRAQIRAFREMGLGGFFMHSRTGGNEVFRPWPPYEAVFDDGLRRDGTDEIEVVVYGHRRNAFGPFYVNGGVDTPDWCGPDQMRDTTETTRTLVPFGLGIFQ